MLPGQRGTSQARTLQLALSQGADAYEPKPVDAARLVDAVERLLGTKALTARGKIGAE